MRVLVTGAAGQLGAELVQVCTAAGDEVVACTRSQLDVADRGSVEQVVGAVQPDVVLSSAAWTEVDACEGDPTRAFAVNALGPRWLADATRRTGGHLVHVSTDYVFDGRATRPYTEWDPTNPLSVYGRSKLAGEREVAEIAPGSTIVRTGWVCGAHGSNVVKTALRLLDGDDVAFVDDQVGCPTFTADLAPLLRRLALERRPGLHHVTNQGVTSWFGLVRQIFELCGRDPGVVRPITTEELQPPRAAPRPRWSVLDNSVLRSSGIELLPPYEASLRALVRELSGT